MSSHAYYGESPLFLSLPDLSISPFNMTIINVLSN